MECGEHEHRQDDEQRHERREQQHADPIHGCAAT
jgi:hypothetical protein